jgi:uncharacterized protein
VLILPLGVSPGETMSSIYWLHLHTAERVAFFALALLCGIGVAGAQETRFFRIGAAATSGSFFEIGGVIASAISKPAGSLPCEHGGNCGVVDLVAVAEATQGSVENLRLVASGQLESGIAQSDIVSWAYAGTGAFAADGPMKQLRAIASLFPESLQLVVRAASPIQTLGDLRGRRISLGETESGTLADARIVLAASGLTETDLIAEYLPAGTAGRNLEDGTLDGFFAISGVPSSAIREVAATTSIRLVPIDDEVLSRMKKEYGLYHRSVIPAATYPGVNVETPSIGFHALWVVSADASEDLIYAITKALWNAATQRLLQAHNPIGSSVRLEGALDGLSVPLHPGAKRFYREAGLKVKDDGLPDQRG